MSERILDIRDLCVTLPTPDGPVQILDRVSLGLDRGETLGIIGESGSGKSMLALTVMGLLPPGATVTGQILLNGRDLVGRSSEQMRDVRGSQISMIFQEPMTALDPVFTVGSQLVETIRSRPGSSRRQARASALEMLRAVGISDPTRRFDQYPHQLSGGMRQRVMIGMALSCEPSVIIADEPTTAVDLTIQAQLLELIKRLADERGTSVIFITHDVGVVAEICDRVSVMYAGQVVEHSGVDELLTDPEHPYTSGLIGAIPRLEDRGRRLTAIPGRVPRPRDFPPGCRFQPRCAFATPECGAPVRLDAISEARPDHLVRCIHADDLALPGVLAGMTLEGTP